MSHLAAAPDAPAKAKRKKVQVRRQVIDQAVVHLGNFLTFITSMSHKAVQQAGESQLAQASARKQFMQLFGEVIATISALDEARDPSSGAATREILGEIARSDEYKAMRAMMESDRIKACYIFADGVECDSEMMPGERCAEVALNQPCADFGGWLIGKICSIAGSEFLVLAVEYAPLKPPFKAGDKIRLVVRAIAADGSVDNKPHLPETKADEPAPSSGPAAEDGPAQDAQSVH